MAARPSKSASPHHARVVHSEAIEDAPLHELRERGTGPLFDHQLKHLNALTGVGKASAGIELEVEPLVAAEFQRQFTRPLECDRRHSWA